MKEISISASALRAGYSFPVIEDITFSVKGGEIMTVIGPNGSGKSTLLKALAGELRRFGGSVAVCGSDITSLNGTERAKKLSLMLTDRIKPPLMTCRDVAEAGRYPYTGRFGMLSGKDKDAVSDALRLAGAEDIAEKQFGSLSDGQQQKALLARALCQEPEILILDEPSSYLDIHHKIALLNLLRRLADERDMAIILSMHELNFASEISDFTLCIKDGALYRAGKPEDIFNEDVISGLFDIDREMYKKYFNHVHN